MFSRLQNKEKTLARKIQRNKTLAGHVAQCIEDGTIKVLGKSQPNPDFKLAHISETKDALSESPTYTELTKRVTDAFNKQYETTINRRMRLKI